MEASILDYGVDMFSFNKNSMLLTEKESIIMSNKRLFPNSKEE
jgi:hypothetical protein